MDVFDAILSLFDAILRIHARCFALVPMPAVLVVVGVALSPFAITATLIVASKKENAEQIDMLDLATKTFGYSAMMFAPWVYFISQMLGRTIPSKYVRRAYALMFWAWLFSCPAFGMLVSFLRTLLYNIQIESSIPEFFVVGLLVTVIVLAANIGLIFYTKTVLSRSVAKGQGSSLSIDCAYLTPLVVWLVADIVSLFIMLLVIVYTIANVYG